MPQRAASRKHALQRWVVLPALAAALVLLCMQLFRSAACAQDSAAASKGPWMDNRL
jgi:hypothetical protein